MAKTSKQFIALVLLSSLVGCAGTEQKTPSQKPKPAVNPTKLEKKVDNKTSAEMLQYALSLQGYNRRSAIIMAAQYAYIEEKSNDVITNIINEIDFSEVGTLDQEFALLEILVATQNVESATLIITRLEQGVIPKAYQASLNILKNKLLSEQQAHLSVLRNAFRTKSLYKEVLHEAQQTELNRQIWLHIQQVPNSTLQQFNSEFGQLAGQWTQLVKLIQLHLGKPKVLQQQLSNWLSEFQKSEPTQWLPETILALSQRDVVEMQNIALLLPFSGNLAKQSNAIKIGFLSNLVLYPTTNVFFLDTETLSLQQIEQQLQDKQIDFIVGPLLKNRIDEYSKSDVIQQIPRLYLNRLDESLSAKEEDGYYFSLAPEDEIEQAVEYFIEKKYEFPAIIYANNSWGNRLSEQFNNQWKMQVNRDVESNSFSSRSKLGDAVKDLLDVSNSEARINQMESLFGRNLKSEKRSRNDIDAIYIIADSQETRLLKPFFDVNLSTFGDPLPIYASSRSYVVGETKEQKKDLNGLIFTEMPWLINNNSNVQATAIYNAVELNNTQLKKLFAFGYDAADLLPKLQHLAILPNMKVTGLSGQLQLNGNHQIKRTLSWTQYRQGRVVELSKTP